MDIAVPMKFVPDLVEELEIDADSGMLDRTFLRLVPNELDEHALEQAILLKEKHGGTVTVLALDVPDVDEALFTAKAKGVDRVIKISGDGFEDGLSNHAIASILKGPLSDLSFDLLLTGTQAVDDLDGHLAPLLASSMELPYVGYVVDVSAENGSVVATKEYPGGLTARIATHTPAVLGIQAAPQAPRYVVTSLVMEAMKTAEIEEIPVDSFETDGAAEVTGMSIPEAGKRAEMLEGDASAVAEAIINVLRENGLIS